MTPYESIQMSQARLMGFAMAVRDLHEMGMDMSHETITEQLIAYVKEFESARDKYYATAN